MPELACAASGNASTDVDSKLTRRPGAYLCVRPSDELHFRIEIAANRGLTSGLASFRLALIRQYLF